MECLCSGRHDVACVGLKVSGCLVVRPSGNEVTELGVVTGRLTCATVSGNARDSKWSPAPTVGQEGSAVRSLAHPWCRFCVRQAAFAVIGRHRALLKQGFFADGVVSQPADSQRSRWRWQLTKDQ